MVPNHQPVIKVEFPMLLHKTIGLPYDAKHMIVPLDFRKKNMFSPLGRTKKNMASPCEYRATIFCTATNSATIYLTLKHV